MQWCVYIVKCADGTYYTGCTNNVTERILTHNAGKGAKYTRSRLPVRLLYIEVCENRSTASIRESAIKKLSRREKEELFSQ